MVPVDGVAADEVARVDHALGVGAGRLGVEAVAAQDGRRDGRARRRRVDAHQLVAVDEGDDLARDVGLDVVARLGVADLVGALARQHVADDPRARRLGPRQGVDLAVRHHRTAGGRVVDAVARRRVLHAVEALLEQPQQRAAGAEGQLRAEGLDAHRPGGRALDLGGRLVDGAQHERAGAAQAHLGGEGAVGARLRAARLEHLAAVLELDEDLLTGDGGLQAAGHRDHVVLERDLAALAAHRRLGPEAELARGRRRSGGGGRRRRRRGHGRSGRRRGKRVLRGGGGGECERRNRGKEGEAGSGHAEVILSSDR